MSEPQSASERLVIFDTTLRDGEQTPGVALTPEQKLAIAQKLDTLGVDAIEAGFPIVSDGEMKAIKSIAAANLSAEICGLARTEKNDIDAAISAGLKYVHTFIATSDIHLKYKLKIIFLYVTSIFFSVSIKKLPVVYCFYSILTILS